MIVIENSNRTMVICGALPERGGGRVHKSNGHAAPVRLFQFERNSRLRVLAELERSRAAWRTWIFGQDLLMLLHFPSRVLGATGLLIKPAQLVVCRWMLRLELQHRFKRADSIFNMSPSFLGQAKLEIQSGH